MVMRTNIMTLKYVFKYLKKCAFSAKIRDFGFDAQSIPVVAELSNFNTCVFSQIGTFFAVMQNFSKKKRDFEPLYCLYSKCLNCKKARTHRRTLENATMKLGIRRLKAIGLQ